jgi:hypothetical protein
LIGVPMAVSWLGVLSSVNGAMTHSPLSACLAQ